MTYFEDIWEAMWAGLIVVAVLSLGTLFFAPKNIDYYYAGGGQDGTSCVYAHWTFHADEKAYCSSDPSKVLMFMSYANNHLRPTDSPVLIVQPPVGNIPNGKDIQ